MKCFQLPGPSPEPQPGALDPPLHSKFAAHRRLT